MRRMLLGWLVAGVVWGEEAGPPAAPAWREAVVEAEDLRQVLREWREIPEALWKHKFSHVAGRDRTGTLALKDGRKGRWLLRPGGLARLEFEGGPVVHLVENLPWEGAGLFLRFRRNKKDHYVDPGTGWPVRGELKVEVFPPAAPGDMYTVPDNLTQGSLVVRDGEGERVLLQRQVMCFFNFAQSPNGRLVACAIPGRILVLDREGKTVRDFALTTLHPDLKNGCAFHLAWQPDGRALACMLMCVGEHGRDVKPDVDSTTLVLPVDSEWPAVWFSLPRSEVDGELDWVRRK